MVDLARSLQSGRGLVCGEGDASLYDRVLVGFLESMVASMVV